MKKLFSKAKKEDSISRVELISMLDDDAKSRSIENDEMVEKLYLLNGVDQDKHNFVTDGKPIKIDDIFWANEGVNKLEMVQYIIEEIKIFNGQSINIKKNKGEKLNGH